MGTEALRSSITLSDGTECAFDWAYPGADQFEWQFEREHWPEPLTSMEAWIWQFGQPGSDRAWDEAGVPAPLMFHRFQTVGPYLYINVTEPPPERMAAMAPPIVALGKRSGGALPFWQNDCESRIRQACADLGSMAADADLLTVSQLLFYGFHQTFTSLTLLFIPGMRLGGLLGELQVPDAELAAFELTQGGENATQAIDEEIWNLAELARGTPAVVRTLESYGNEALDALRRDPEASTFVAAFDALIERHGRRSQGWMLTLPTWGERPSAALSLVRAQVLNERVTPDELRERTARRRAEATQRVLDMLPPERHDEFHALIAELDGYVAIREGRAYWQLVIIGSMRAFLLRAGEAHARAGRFDRADDIFYVTPDDLRDGPADLRAVVAQGRASWERWRAVRPPDVIGTPGKAAAEAAAARTELKGTPASRGVVTAPVRILHSPEEGDKLQRGDILVCTLTTPAWTPLFAIAGGIITETGGALSHPAITAREYGIPAVMALADATKKFKDGQVVTIDGMTGSVTAAS